MGVGLNPASAGAVFGERRAQAPLSRYRRRGVWWASPATFVVADSGSIPTRLGVARDRAHSPHPATSTFPSKDGPQDGVRQGVAVIIIRGDGAITPEEFRRNADARMALEAREQRVGAVSSQ